MKPIVKLVQAILMFNLSSETNVAARISDARLIGNDANGKTGAVQVLDDGIWKSVCRRGNDKYDQIWGSKEAAVVCRQLGFQGGWTLEATTLDHNSLEDDDHFIDDFRCFGDETTLDRCYHDRRQYVRGTAGCGQNNYAGAQCFEQTGLVIGRGIGRELGVRYVDKTHDSPQSSFEVRLIGGTKPNAGRVQLKYDKEWTNVCYNSVKNRGWRDWGFYAVQVVCRELGYPGAMMKQRGGYGDAQGRAYIHGFKCIGNEKGLKDCLSNTPTRDARHQRYICGPRNEAVAICADPGYSGCYSYKDIPIDVIADRVQSPQMTLRICKDYCRQKQYRFAALYEGHICYCGTKDLLMHSDRLTDTKCRDPCGGNDHEICGGYNVLSVYDVDMGICVDPFNKSNSYYYGDIVNSVICDVGYELYGASSVQCIMGYSWNDTRWSGPFPSCREQIGKELRTFRFTLTAIWVAVACFSLLAATVTIVMEFTIGRVCTRTKDVLLSKTIHRRSSSIHESLIAPSEHVYESSMRSVNVPNLYSSRRHYQRTSSTSSGDRYQSRRVKWATRNHCRDIDNQRRGLFRNSDDDVVAYIIRTKL